MTRGGQEASWRRQAGGNSPLETSVPCFFLCLSTVTLQSYRFCFGSVGSAPPRTLQRPAPHPLPHTPTPLGAHLLQRPWDRCTLLPAVLGREHF